MGKQKAVIVNSSVHLLVSGIVQGIGYRWFVQRAAIKNNVSGWVRNLDSGDVEVQACGTKEDIDTFIENIRNGHPYSKVDDIKIQVLPDGAVSCGGFDIQPD